MNPFEEISIELVQVGDMPQVSANIKAILHEISTQIDALLNTGQGDSIDLRSLPLLPGEYEALKVILGEGEISARLDTFGVTHIYETGLSGVWWVIHDDEHGERLAEFIEVTALPDILKSDPAEIRHASHALQQQLSEWTEEVMASSN